MSAWIDILRTSFSRNAMRSRLVITMPATRRAMPLLRMLTRISLTLTDASLNSAMGCGYPP